MHICICSKFSHLFPLKCIFLSWFNILFYCISSFSPTMITSFVIYHTYLHILICIYEHWSVWVLLIFGQFHFKVCRDFSADSMCLYATDKIHSFSIYVIDVHLCVCYKHVECSLCRHLIHTYICVCKATVCHVMLSVLILTFVHCLSFHSVCARSFNSPHNH